jgi:hypothetical protein
VNQYQLARQKAKEEEPKKALEGLFDQPSKPKWVEAFLAKGGKLAEILVK